MKLISAMVLASLCSTVSLSGQSLAEVAKKELERRKTVKGSSKVYTNSDLKSYPPPLVAPVPEPDSSSRKAPDASPKAVPASDASSEEKSPAKDEAYWRNRITEARTQLERSKMFLEALQTRINSLTTDFVSRDDPAQRAVIGNDRQKALAEMERVRAEIQQLTKDIAAIEEEARQAGVPPGWLR